MSPHAYSEDQLVEQPAIALFGEMGWKTVRADEESFGPIGTLQRETKSEVVLATPLRGALTKLNPSLPAEAIDSAVVALTRDRSAMSLEAANQEIYELLKQGITVSVPDRERGGQKMERLRVIDWEHPENNDFLLVSQLSITGQLYTCRPDLVGFVNGLPLMVIEFKKPGVPARVAFDENLTHYKREIPSLFWYNAFLIASNGTESRVGSLTADWGRFFEWKRIEREDEPRRVSLEVMLRGTCDPRRLLDLVENFTLFSKHKSGLVKIIGQNHQFLGVNNAITSMLAARAMGHGRGGVFWQTQGSGKSFSMVFFAQKVLRKVAGNWSFVVVTDRVELDEQIATTFKATGAVTEAEGDMCHAGSGSELRELLRGNHRYVFTLIQKFQTPEVLCDRSDVIVLTDEAHRSQYDTLALNMRAALPKALFLAFTGTPLIAGEERTKEVFGDYVSIYDFQQSVEDGATVPLFYENRTPELQLVNPDLNDQIYDLIEEAQLNPEQESKLERELSRQYHIITRDDRLETVAKDIVNHFLGRGFQGKAMVVSIDKATALRMHAKVCRLWDEEIVRVSKDLAGYQLDPEITAELEARLKILQETDMAVIVSPGQNEIDQMQKLGLDIRPHRERMNAEELDEKFKETEDPLRLVFVCAMWLTGFDAPSCSTIYLDKPMRNHTLMQTIARANRVFPGKHSGLIVDYANVFASLEKSLAVYGAGQGGVTPVRNKEQLIADLRKAIDEATQFCASKRVNLSVIEEAPPKTMERLNLLSEAVNALISPDPLRKEFLAHDRIVRTLYDAVKPSPEVLVHTPRVSCLVAIADAIKSQLNPNPPDVSVVMGRINELLDQSIEGVEMAAKPLPLLDLSKIDFAALAKRFKNSKKKNIELEALKASVKALLDRLIAMNRTRTNYTEKFEELIEAYNNGSKTIEQLYQELLELSRNLSEEEARHVRENLTEEELTVFDLLTRPGPELSTDEKEEVKKVARLLHQRLQRLITFNWRQTIQARALVKNAIEETLDEGLPRAYAPELYKNKCGVVFEHVYETYSEEKARA
ncbi:MAG: type I restriction endonuclease subunit R [Chthoniobacterales bacterium]